MCIYVCNCVQRCYTFWFSIWKKMFTLDVRSSLVRACSVTILQEIILCIYTAIHVYSYIIICIYILVEYYRSIYLTVHKFVCVRVFHDTIGVGRRGWENANNLLIYNYMCYLFATHTRMNMIAKHSEYN